MTSSMSSPCSSAVRGLSEDSLLRLLTDAAPRPRWEVARSCKRSFEIMVGEALDSSVVDVLIAYNVSNHRGSTTFSVGTATSTKYSFTLVYDEKLFCTKVVHKNESGRIIDPFSTSSLSDCIQLIMQY